MTGILTYIGVQVTGVLFEERRVWAVKLQLAYAIKGAWGFGGYRVLVI